MSTLELDISLPKEAFNLSVKQQFSLSGITAIFGHSGSGKSSLLRVIAGLENHCQGDIVFDQIIWQQSSSNTFIAAEKRDVTLVFQDARLFPHLSVLDNLNYAIKRQKSKTSRHSTAFNSSISTLSVDLKSIVNLCNIEHLLNKNADKLSGGEKQRVAIARAVLNQPKLLLLDEPLSALDSNNKANLITLLKGIHQHFNLPMLYVSHQLDEIQQLANQLMVLESGSVIHHGDVNKVIHQLNNTNYSTNSGNYIAPQTSLTLPVIKQNNDYGLTSLALADNQEILFTHNKVLSQGQNQSFNEKLVTKKTTHLPLTPMSNHAINEQVNCYILAEDISISREKAENSSIVNILSGTIVSISTDQHSVMVTVNCGQQDFFALISHFSQQKLSLAVGMHVFIQFKASSVKTLTNHQHD
jgi:molybdate transport system ATP-binding protein